MEFIKAYARNLVLLFVIVIALFIFSPDLMNQVSGVFGGLFGPVAFLLIFVFALPGRSRHSRRR